MARKFNYKGLTEEELKNLSLEEFIKLIPTSAKRTLKRMSYQVKSFLKNYRKNKGTYKTHTRQMVIIPEMLGDTIKVYGGKDWVDVKIVPEMLGKRLGDYTITIKSVKHSGPGVGATRGSKSVELK
ncbi:MAG: ribosomal protein S19 family protein [Candidatus Micrarchaeota archaeon]